MTRFQGCLPLATKMLLIVTEMSRQKEKRTLPRAMATVSRFNYVTVSYPNPASILPCSILSASPRSALRLPFGLPSLSPCGVRLRFGGLSFPNCDATPSNRSAEASRAPRGHVSDDPLASDGDRVGRPPPEPAPMAPGKPPKHTTDHLRSDFPTHSGHASLAGLAPIPRSCLAAFSRLPSVLPCGFPSGFPHSHHSILT
jgi:hypothetical protein